jgi:hypothetical protein
LKEFFLLLITNFEHTSSAAHKTRLFLPLLFIYSG